jgi:hypothetical protein
MGEDSNHQPSQGCRFPDWPVKFRADMAVRTPGNLATRRRHFTIERAMRCRSPSKKSMGSTGDSPDGMTAARLGSNKYRPFLSPPLVIAVGESPVLPIF